MKMFMGKRFCQVMGAVLFLLLSSTGFSADLSKANGISVTVNSSPAVGDSPTPPNPKQITIINNSNMTIYPYIFIGKHEPLDQWMQAFFRVLNPSDKNTPDKFPSTKIYRVYVGYDDKTDPTNPIIVGMAPGTVATINVPLYSELVPKPTYSDPNQYIDWWNGGRVLISDDKDIINNNFQIDRPNAVNLPDPYNPSGVSCASAAPSEMPKSDLKYECSLSPIYAADTNFAGADTLPEQLTEYTFAGIDPSQNPYGWSTQNVDYDISYVDHVYLPVAMEPVNNKAIGYVGTVKPVDEFRSILSNFVKTVAWPIYNNNGQDYQYKTQKIPGTYNVMMSDGNNIPDSKEIDQIFINNWFECVIDENSGSHSLCVAVDDLFKKNYKNFAMLCGDNEPPLDPNNYVQHLYGFVAFNTCKNNTQLDNSLAFTPGADFGTAEKDYKSLQYAYNTILGNGLSFNPFVKFIHDAEYLNIKGSYAFSIDDIVGNMQVLGDGIYIAVGGSTGLPNGTEYNPTKIVHVDLGSPLTSLKWKAYQVCGSDIATSLRDDTISFEIQSELISDPCDVYVFDTDDNKYYFQLKGKAPFVDPVSQYIQCNSGDTLWCGNGGVNASFSGENEAKRSTVSTPPPISPTTITMSFGFQARAPTWTSYRTCADNKDNPIQTDSEGHPESVILEHTNDLNKYSFPCKIAINDSQNKSYYFKLNHAAPFTGDFSSYISCVNGDGWCNPNQVNISVKGALPQQESYINIPPPNSKYPSTLVAPAINSAYRDDTDPGKVYADIIPSSGGTPSYAYSCHYSENGNSHLASCSVSGESVTFTNLPTDDIKITITATDSATPQPQSAISNAYDVPAADNTLIAPVIKSTARDLTTPSNVTAKFAAAQGGSKQFNYDCSIDGGKNFVNCDNGNLTISLTNVPLTATPLIIRAKDIQQGSSINSAPVTIGQAPIKVVIPAKLADDATRNSATPTTVTVGFTPASGGSGEGFDYAAYVNNASVSTFTISGNQMTLNNVTKDAASIYVMAIDKGGSKTEARSNIVSVSAVVNPIVAPVINNAYRNPGNKNTVIVNYTPASGGVGALTIAYNVNGVPSGQVQQKAPTQVWILNVPQGANISITLKDSAGNSATSNTVTPQDV